MAQTNWTLTSSQRAEIYNVSQTLIPIIQSTAKDIGWCAVIHGSMSRDLDILLVPWATDSGSTSQILESIRLAIAHAMHGECYLINPQGEVKPHGRLAFTLVINSENIVHTSIGAYPFIDISVMDIRN